MTPAPRPRIAILGRFAEQTSVTRWEGLVTARKLAEGVWAGGGEPLTLLPVANSDWTERMRGVDGMLMPGGGDLNPRLYGHEATTEEVYGIDDLQDETDLGLLQYTLDAAVPVLAVCRGLQLVNTLRGGTLVQDMDIHHRHHVASVTVLKHSEELGLSNPTLKASCYHHQVIDMLGDGLEVIAHSAEGHIEAVKIESPGWAFGVQWHPEDNFAEERGQAELFEQLVLQAARARG